MGLTTHKPRPNYETWVWVRWQVNHKWAYCSAVARRLPRRKQIAKPHVLTKGRRRVD